MDEVEKMGSYKGESISTSQPLNFTISDFIECDYIEIFKDF